MTWIKDHMASQDGSAMITAICTNFLGLAQVERIIQYARAKMGQSRLQIPGNLHIKVQYESAGGIHAPCGI